MSEGLKVKMKPRGKEMKENTLQARGPLSNLTFRRRVPTFDKGICPKSVRVLSLFSPPMLGFPMSRPSLFRRTAGREGRRGFYRRASCYLRIKWER